jgi:hydroxysqualene synthase
LSTPLQHTDVQHAENFPVASLLLPKQMRPAVVAVYRFARFADDLADEGEAATVERLADLAALAAGVRTLYRKQTIGGDLSAAAQDRLTGLLPFIELLPEQALLDLISAFQQDLVKTRYADWPELLDYCSRSANPVGRLMLAVFGVNSLQALTASDCICSGLQLINFWQDVAIDWRKGRVYAPLADCLAHGLSPEAFAQAASPVLIELVARSETLLQQGRALIPFLPLSVRLEIRLTLAGGLLIAKKIKAARYNVWQARPVLRKRDLPALIWLAFTL